MSIFGTNEDARAGVGWITAAASYMAMNFTGTTPFTSLSGVKHEMRLGLAVQCGASALALVLWITAPFTP